MVNVPPIPPLLCSTPPPIDFGDDEDMDVLPSSLHGMYDDEFGGYLSEDDIKAIEEPLPSPRPPSACDLPPINIYDGLIPPDKELTNHITRSTDAKSNLVEAYNYNVTKNIQNDAITCSNQNEYEVETEYKSLEILETDSNKCSQFSQTMHSEDVKHSIDTNLSRTDEKSKIKKIKAETKYKSNKIDMISIEDIDDDLSDDELYSPKTPKNFSETENVQDFFKIEEIKTLNTAENETKLASKNVDASFSNPIDNNEVSSMKNENKKDCEFQSFSNNNFIQNKFDVAPSLSNDANHIYDDDFGDFADFQEAHFTNNEVPVNDINIKKHNDLEIKDFNDFTKHDTTTDNKNINKDDAKTIENSDNVENLNEKLNNINITSTISNDFHIKHESSLDLHKLSQETLTTKTESNLSQENSEAIPVIDENKDSLQKFGHYKNSSSNLSVTPENIKEQIFENFAEFPESSENFSNIYAEPTERNEQQTKYSTDTSNNDDEFGDFADFESHQVTRLDNNTLISTHHKNNDCDNDDDDDFGDFNTAESIAVNISSTALIKTSQNTITDTPTSASKNLNERISKILQIMFSTNINPTEENFNQPKASKIQDIPFTSIDAAKALEFQWLISDTRHSFIRSLGIDSRNILFGDNWNPSLPRFAANLSFNPLKPLKPVQSFNNAGEPSSILKPIPVNNSERKQAFDIISISKNETLDLDCNSLIATEQTIEAFKDKSLTTALASAASIEPSSTVPESLTIFESPLDNEEKLSKTPPISEMESVTTFSSSLPTATMNIELPITQIELQDTSNINEVVVTSTFTGSFKETHIYTPPQTNDSETKHTITTLPASLSSPTKALPIDFDYEKAAMGVIIDETVVKKEYRDVEYNPPFTMDSISRSGLNKTDKFEANSYVNSNPSNVSATDIDSVKQDEQEANDDFSEFQSVSSEVTMPAVASITKTTRPSEIPSHGGMILSPAILIPQAISLESQKPKIEWGDSTATINPEELARIEELFPEPKSHKSSNGSNSSQKSTPTHQVAYAPSISATVANKELERNVNNINDDDEDWSDFVSVTVTNYATANKTVGNNNTLTKSSAGSPFQQRSPIVIHRTASAVNSSNSNNDDEWSEFVSSAPPPLQQPTPSRVPQFNSGAWQNANFYNNPLSMYHKGPINIPTTTSTTNSAQKYLFSNNNNYNISQQPYQIANNIPPAMLASNQQTSSNAYQQQIHVMQNFSTAPVPTPERLSAAAAAAKNNQFQSIGSAKVAPSIALIPDLGFVAPAVPTHTSFINSLPKPSINIKK